jgi:paraquat-inducible protein B
MNDTNDISKPIVIAKSRFSVVWLLPLIAVIIGAGMVYQQWQNKGIEIVIVFDNAKGLEAKKTKVKFRDVDIGTLQEINFSDDGFSIEAMIEIDKKMQSYLLSDSQFWVVRPRIGSAGITGFGTLLSGAYINITPGKSESLSQRFVGLENPPISSPTSQGIKLKLISGGGKSLTVGNPVTYRGFEVGAVESVNFDIESRQVTYSIFIQAPYDGLITTNTYFWNSSGLSFAATTDGITIDLASIESLLSGGVRFDVPDDLMLGERITQSSDFKLYSSRASIKEDRVYEYIEYVILVDDTVGGLQAGAPVEYRGIRIGRVSKPYLGFYETNQIDREETRIPVIIHLEPARLASNNEYDLPWFNEQFNKWIKSGLAARLETANYLTGTMKVSLDLGNDIQPEVEYFGKYTVIPSAQTGFASIVSKTDRLLSKLESLPLDALVQITNTAISSANTAILSANDTVIATQSVLLSVEDTLKEASLTLQGMQPDSPVYLRLERNLDELERTMQMMQPFLQEIRQKPNSLIFGGSSPADIQPQGKGQQ